MVFWDVTLQNTSTSTSECGKTSQETVILAPYNVKTPVSLMNNFVQ
jgi:hypothetical protein